ncbi:CPBP family glutamic-type intramembrane protease [Mesorhizobium sophorae]|uniref:CPBP family glutamic-type intramembrane protease n=1 Tax=Mesorhizobium sophorae TaxID=1300294 RepID=UPI001FD9BFBC|nr:CPBP family intramembrane glutamic endopeptidase [Mesorhizobium sophorae]
MIDPAAFERYRHSPNARTTLPRLFVGTAIVVLFWAATTVAVLFGGAYLFFTWQASAAPSADGAMQDFLASPIGILTALTSFAGIWIGLWIAMRWLHGEKLSALFSVSRRVSRSGFLKGLIAVLITSFLSEILLYLLQPEIARGPISLSSWLLFLIPIVALTLLQTSSEEVLFRGYLLRGLASRFKSPFIWALLPALLHLAALEQQRVGRHQRLRAGLGRRFRAAFDACGLCHRQSRGCVRRPSRQQSERIPADLAPAELQFLRLVRRQAARRAGLDGVGCNSDCPDRHRLQPADGCVAAASTLAAAASPEG